ncbi:hybrid sensor histidine kinase/response regulator [Paraburkholderia fungorum]|jgi:signal transduction histidine kinase/CheY-like chemotaxis protein|uniref:hybrid sensor histidine kinase/response regulator n=1 Tax=Paraburkholderia fungorum TaxID=134537 RepID=UPI000DB88B78|nr:ATP-binding protein [Paraburkholderia fungorum]PZR48329.1 MAG: two-component system sensor histidine kinase/response regulator [Paraburkholderia fungorum]QLD52360.1 two-component system sensor histidine kinase/response regulator [Paraburkholderia fungorum]
MESNRAPSQTDELARRPARAADYAAENRALVALARVQAGPRSEFLQAIADTALSLCHADSAGISLVEGPDDSRVFRWFAVAGLCADLRGKTTTWNECPCGVTLEAGAPQLFINPQARFPCLRFPGVEVPEGIVVPIPADNGALGAIWVMSHAQDCRFDLEDVRLLSNLAVFAGSGLTIVNARDSGEESDRRHNEFIAMLSHELRNPMTPIDGAISAAKRLCVEDERAVEMLTVAQRQMRHLRTLVDDLLDAARLKHGKLAIKHSDTSLSEIVFDAVTAIRHHILSRRHTLRITGLDEPVYVRADHVRLSQVLGNLLSNAAKYTPVGGTIELNVRVEANNSSDQSDALLVIDVADNGMGIDSAVQPRVFDLFAQSARGRARSEGGLGIGLAVAKRMVELHQGTISLRSEGSGKGTVVTLRLPILQKAVDAADIAARKMPSMTPEPARLLLVDDNQDALRALSVLLELEGHEVTTSDNGRDAIRLMSEKHPEVAIVDVGMPEMDGFEVARTVRLNHRLDDMVLVALTGYASESDKSRALAAGFDFHLTKPLSLDKLQYILANRADGTLRGIV